MIKLFNTTDTLFLINNELEKAILDKLTEDKYEESKKDK